MKQILSPVWLLYNIYAFLLFFICMLLVFPLVVMSSFFGRINGGNFIYSLCRLWSDVNLAMWGIQHCIMYNEPHDNSRQYVFVFNHISYLDIPLIFKSIRHQHFRILGKAELGKIPVFGFIYRQAVVMVDRSSPQNRAKSVRQLKSVINKGISVVIAPEGTFNSTHQPLKEFYDGAFKVAIETQTPIKPILFLDAYDRMSYKKIFSLTPGKSRAVFLAEIPVQGLTINDLPALKEKVYALMEEKLIAYKASWIENL